MLRFDGANDVTRTHDLLITKHVQIVHAPQNRRFPPFSLPRRILSGMLVSISSVGSFRRVGHGVGQEKNSSKFCAAYSKNGCWLCNQAMPYSGFANFSIRR